MYWYIVTDIHAYRYGSYTETDQGGKNEKKTLRCTWCWNSCCDDAFRIWFCHDRGGSGKECCWGHEDSRAVQRRLQCRSWHYCNCHAGRWERSNDVAAAERWADRIVLHDNGADGCRNGNAVLGIRSRRGRFRKHAAVCCRKWRRHRNGLCPYRLRRRRYRMGSIRGFSWWDGADERSYGPGYEWWHRCFPGSEYSRGIWPGCGTAQRADGKV